MKRLVTSALVGAVLLAGAVPVGAQEGAPMTMPGGLKVMPDGNDMDWQPAPASLPKGMMITLLAGDPAKPGPFTLRLTMPANTVIAPHTHSKDESVTVISGDFYHGHDKTIDKSKGTEVHSGGFVFLPADHVHSLWTGSEPAVIQVTGTGPFGVQYLNPADDPSKGHS